MDALTTTTSKPAAARATLPNARSVLVAATVVSLALWYVPGAALVLYPIRLFVTTVHEGCHAITALLTGGAVQSVSVFPNTSGVTLTLGGLPFFIYMAGYVGATLCGAALLQLSRHRGRGKLGLMLIAVVVLGITVLWMRPLGQSAFGFFMGLLVGAVLLAAGRFLPEAWAAFLLAFLSVQLCLNALFDLRDLLWLTTHTASDNDAVFMAQMFGFAPWFWALLWAVAAAVILAAGLRSYWRGTK